MKRAVALFAAFLTALMALSGCRITQVEPASSQGASVTATQTGASSASSEVSASTTAATQTEAAKTTAKSTTTRTNTTTTTTAAPAPVVTSATAPVTTTEPQGQTVASNTAPATLPPTEIQEESAIVGSFTPVSVEDYYGRRQLEQAGKQDMLTAYMRMASAAERMEEGAVYVGDLDLNADEIKQVYSYYVADFPQHFWRDTGYRYEYLESGRVVSLTLQYILEREELSAAKQQVERRAAQLLQGISPAMEPYDREKQIHDRLVQAVEYDTTFAEPYIHSLYGALVEGTAVCDGYAHAFQYLLYQVGIPCLFVTGRSADQDHAWNMVQLDDAYYHVDVTWDDPVYDQTLPFDKPVFYAYFNVTDEQIQQDHTLDADNYPLPSCTETAANYFVRHDAIVDDFEVDEAAALLAAAVEAGENMHVYVQGDAQAYHTRLSIMWTDVCRKAAVAQTGAQTLLLGQELVVILP